MHLQEAIREVLLEGYVSSHASEKVMETVKRFLSHNMAQKSATSEEMKAMMEMLDEDHMP